MKKIYFIGICIMAVGIVLAGRIKQKSDLIFSHKYHAEEAGAECTDCHQTAEESLLGTDDLLPAMTTCFDCHEDEEDNCSFCHRNRKEERIILSRIDNYSPKFNHKKHADEGIDCISCHEGIEGKDLSADERHLPVMSDCMKCHETPQTIAGCYKCHTTNQSLKPDNHSFSWKYQHGMESESGERSCSNCHTETYCTDCHHGSNLFNESHAPGFIATHAISYGVRESNCENCHQGLDDCRECHTQVNYVIPVNHTMPAWRGVLHAEEGRADFDNCMVCHTQDEATCSSCHNF
jgi:hypothetical protein